MDNLPVSQLAPEFVAALREEAGQYVKADKEHSARQWRIGHLVHDGLEEYRGGLEEYWTLVIYELNTVAGGWVAFSDSNVKRWERTYRRFESVNIESYINALSFEHFAVAGELVNGGRCKSVQVALDWAINNGGSAEDMKEAFHQGGPNAPAWDAWKSAWVSLWTDKYKKLPETVRARIDPLRQEIDKIIQESETA